MIMAKVAVVYWSGTGNTETMASAVAEGAKEKGAEVSLLECSEFNASMMDSFDAVAFGCPSMGNEQLEEDEFEPMFSSCEEKLKDKKIALFGSYGWGDGEWMQSWEERLYDPQRKYRQICFLIWKIRCSNGRTGTVPLIIDRISQ